MLNKINDKQRKEALEIAAIALNLKCNGNEARDNAGLTQVRSFAETVLKGMFFAKFGSVPQLTFADLIKEAAVAGLIDITVRTLFERVRLAGNFGAHDGE